MMRYVKPGQPLRGTISFRDTNGTSVTADALPTVIAFHVNGAGVAEPASISIAQATDDAAANIVGQYTVTLPSADSAGTGTAAVDGDDIVIFVRGLIGTVPIDVPASFGVRADPAQAGAPSATFS